MSTLHMETGSVRELAIQLRQKMEQLRGEVQSVERHLQTLDWLGPSRDDFVPEAEGVLRALRAQAESGEVLAGRVESEVSEWEQVACALGDSGDFLVQFRAGLPAFFGAGLGGGAAVWGVSTLTPMPAPGGGLVSAADYSAMKWTDKFSAQENLQTEIVATTAEIASRQTLLTALEGQMQALKNSNQALNANLLTVDEQIAALEAKRAEAEKNSQDFWNKLLPDWPLRGDNDGVPWRVKADDYEDEVADYDRQLATLRTERDNLSAKIAANEASLTQLDTQYRQTHQTLLENQAHLGDLQANQAELQKVIDAGIADHGPTTTPAWYAKGFVGCTQYVSERRNVNPNPTGPQDFSTALNGNAQDWVKSASERGWDYGKQPVKGAIMVFDGKASGEYGTANSAKGGHVAYVESVKVENGVYKVTISEASPAKPNNVVPGTTHTVPTTRIVSVPMDGHKYVNYIYER